MLDRTDYESWQQRIHLYCLGKDNGENIMKLIVEVPYQMGTKTVTLAGGIEGALQLGLEEDGVFLDLTQEEKDRYKADICVTNILLQGLPKDIYALINHYNNAKDIWDNVKMLLEGFELTKDDRESQLYDDFKHFHQNKGENIHSYYVTGLRESNFDQLYGYLKQHEVHATENKMMLERYNANNQGRQFQRNNARGFVGTGNAGARECPQLKRHQDSDYFKDQIMLMQAQENGQDLALNVDHVFEADQCDAFDSDVDEAPTTQTMFMVNLSFEDPIYDEAGPSYDSDIPSELQDHDSCSDRVYEHHDVHEMQNNVQQDYVADFDDDYMSDSNIIPYDQYVEDNAEQVVQRNVSSVQNDTLKMIIDDMHEQGVQSISANKQNKVVNDPLTSKLVRYKELVGVYETREKFELTEREQKIDQKIRIIISDQNIMETSLNAELHSVKMQLRSTIDHNTSMKEEVTTLKRDFKEKMINSLKSL
nr:hypothetical protein [Tanacetum cinerariifolium]